MFDTYEVLKALKEELKPISDRWLFRYDDGEALSRQNADLAAFELDAKQFKGLTFYRGIAIMCLWWFRRGEARGREFAIRAREDPSSANWK